MPTKYKLETVLNECDRIVRVWMDNPTFSLGEITLTGLQGKIADVRQKREQLASLRMQVAALSNELDEGTKELAAIRTRALSGYRGVYGPNSNQYEQAGGTRPSEKRKPTRKGGSGNEGTSK